MAEPQLEKLVRQHAETSRLMGVDFVPAYRRGASEAGSDSMAVESLRGAGSRGEEDSRAGSARVESLASAWAEPDAKKGAAQASSLMSGQVSEAKPMGARASASVLFGGSGLGIAPKAPADREVAEQLLTKLRERYAKDAPHKEFVTAFRNIVFGEGDARARLLFIGEAPGEEEDRTGRPFVGRSGELLTKQIQAMGLKREEVYICNVLKTRPPNNATPTSREAELCWPYLQEQIAIVSPEVIVTLGLPAAKIVLKTDQSMTRMRGKWASFGLADGRVIPVMPTYHPAYLLRNYTPEARAQVWSDLQQVMGKLGLTPKEKTAPASERTEEKKY